MAGRYEQISFNVKIKVIKNIFIRHNEIQDSRQSIWFLHGFADSGLAYREVFLSPICDELNVYVVDLPGFGVSPINPNCISMREQADLLALIIRKETNNQQQVNLVAHSLGALIGTWICQSLHDQLNYYFNIEGNLTEADSYFSSKPLGFVTAFEFVDSFNREIFELAKSEERYRRYYSSLRFADPEGMRNWSITSQEHIKGNKCGFEFKGLPCKKIYLWGDVDTPKETVDFINMHDVPNQLYPGIGHWHMLENPEKLYRDMLNFTNIE